MNRILQTCIALVLILAAIACGPGKEDKSSSSADEPKIVVKRRDDGTVTSRNPVDAEGYVHGVRTNYYEDGKTVHSQITYEHGSKTGPAIWYFKNGQIYEHTNYTEGHKSGLTRRYYESGELMEELQYEKGEEVPGSKKRYKKDGSRIQD
jgi:antitoxin component YwqK of YwqJK toxin-antitoxin module